jgi:hypothetical protein
MALDGRAQIPADGPTLHLFAGDAEPTSATLRVSPSAAPEVSDWRPGDGVVLRTSAVMDERVGRPRETRLRSPIDWASTFFLFTDHLGMTRDPAFTDNLLYMLLERPR